MTIAFWCVFAAVLLCFGIARNRGRAPSGERLRDNRNREFPNRIEGLAKRAWVAC
jgi:uncharacterized MAPEG superfamily protein